MELEIKFELSEIQNIEKVIRDQVVKFQNLRNLVKDLEFVPVESIGTYSSVTYKSIDGCLLKKNTQKMKEELLTMMVSHLLYNIKTLIYFMKTLVYIMKI